MSNFFENRRFSKASEQRKTHGCAAGRFNDERTIDAAVPNYRNWDFAHVILLGDVEPAIENANLKQKGRKTLPSCKLINPATDAKTRRIRTNAFYELPQTQRHLAGAGVSKLVQG